MGTPHPLCVAGRGVEALEAVWVRHFKLQDIFFHARVVQFLILACLQLSGPQGDGVALLPQARDQLQQMIETVVAVFSRQEEHASQPV